MRTWEGSGGLRGDGSGLARGSIVAGAGGLNLAQVPRPVETQAWPSRFLSPWTQPRPKEQGHMWMGRVLTWSAGGAGAGSDQRQVQTSRLGTDRRHWAGRAPRNGWGQVKAWE